MLAGTSAVLRRLTPHCELKLETGLEQSARNYESTLQNELRFRSREHHAELDHLLRRGQPEWRADGVPQLREELAVR